MNTNYFLKNFLSIGISIIIAISFLSCSKGNEILDSERTSLNAEKSQYSSYEIVKTLEFDDFQTDQSAKAKINNTDVDINISNKVATFLLPNLDDGNYDLKFSLNQKHYVINLTVSASGSILTADQYFSQIETSFVKSINSLDSQVNSLIVRSANPNEYAALKNDVIKYKGLLADYKVSYNQLSEVDKKEFAKATAANLASINQYDQLIEALKNRNSLLRTVSNYELSVEECSLAFYSCVDETVYKIPFIVAGAIVAKTPIHPIINAGAILATGILVARFMVNVDQTVTAAIILMDKSLAPFDLSTQPLQAVYATGVFTESYFNAKYRSLIGSDGTNPQSGSLITALVLKFDYLKEKYNGFVSKIPAIFQPSYIMASLRNTYDSKTRSIYNQYVSITNVSNPTVSIQKINQADGTIIIMATTTATTDQTFTYSLNYNNSKFAKGLTKTISAKVAVQNCDVNTILGTWRVDMYTVCNLPLGSTQVFFDTYNLVLHQGGQSVVTRSNGETSTGTFNYNADCSFMYSNAVLCSKRVYPPGHPSYQSYTDCSGCLIFKHTKL